MGSISENKRFRAYEKSSPAIIFCVNFSFFQVVFLNIVM